MTKQHTIEDIFEIVSFIKDNAVMKTEFIEFKNQFSGLRSEFGGLKSEFGELKHEVNSINSRLNRVESQMVTKEYLDDKLADLRADIGNEFRRKRVHAPSF